MGGGAVETVVAGTEVEVVIEPAVVVVVAKPLAGDESVVVVTSSEAVQAAVARTMTRIGMARNAMAGGYR